MVGPQFGGRRFVIGEEGFDAPGIGAAVDLAQARARADVVRVPVSVSVTRSPPLVFEAEQTAFGDGLDLAFRRIGRQHLPAATSTRGGLPRRDRLRRSAVQGDAQPDRQQRCGSAFCAG